MHVQAVAAAPTVIYFDADLSFQLYAGGIYQPSECSSNINHAMLAVGYAWGGSSASSYFLIKNSWGSGWGNKGYAQV